MPSAAIDYNAIHADDTYQMGRERRQWISGLLREWGPGDDKRLLDAGCGKGELIDCATAAGWDAEGFDIAPRLASAEKRIRVDDVTRHLPYKDREFDTVVCLDVLEHIERSFIESAVLELVRVANYRVLVNVGLGSSMYDGTDIHISQLPDHEWDGIFTGWVNIAPPTRPPSLAYLFIDMARA